METDPSKMAHRQQQYRHFRAAEPAIQEHKFGKRSQERRAQGRSSPPRLNLLQVQHDGPFVQMVEQSGGPFRGPANAINSTMTQAQFVNQAGPDIAAALSGGFARGGRGGFARFETGQQRNPQKPAVYNLQPKKVPEHPMGGSYSAFARPKSNIDSYDAAHKPPRPTGNKRLYSGTCKAWNNHFGWIEPDDGSPDLFFHRNDLTPDTKLHIDRRERAIFPKPDQQGTRLYFHYDFYDERRKRHRGRPHAVNVHIGEEPLSSSRMRAVLKPTQTSIGNLQDKIKAKQLSIKVLQVLGRDQPQPHNKQTKSSLRNYLQKLKKVWKDYAIGGHRICQDLLKTMHIEQRVIATKTTGDGKTIKKPVFRHLEIRTPAQPDQKLPNQYNLLRNNKHFLKNTCEDILKQYASAIVKITKADGRTATGVVGYLMVDSKEVVFVFTVKHVWAVKDDAINSTLAFCYNKRTAPADEGQGGYSAFLGPSNLLNNDFFFSDQERWQGAAAAREGRDAQGPGFGISMLILKQTREELQKICPHVHILDIQKVMGPAIRDEAEGVIYMEGVEVGAYQAYMDEQRKHDVKVRPLALLHHPKGGPITLSFGELGNPMGTDAQGNPEYNGPVIGHRCNSSHGSAGGLGLGVFGKRDGVRPLFIHSASRSSVKFGTSIDFAFNFITDTLTNPAVYTPPKQSSRVPRATYWNTPSHAEIENKDAQIAELKKALTEEKNVQAELKEEHANQIAAVKADAEADTRRLKKKVLDLESFLEVERDLNERRKKAIGSEAPPPNQENFLLKRHRLLKREIERLQIKSERDERQINHQQKRMAQLKEEMAQQYRQITDLRYDGYNSREAASDDPPLPAKGLLPGINVGLPAKANPRVGLTDEMRDMSLSGGTLGHEPRNL